MLFSPFFEGKQGIASALDSVLQSDLSIYFATKASEDLRKSQFICQESWHKEMFYFSVLLHGSLLKLGQLSNYIKKIILCLFRQAILSMKMSSI